MRSLFTRKPCYMISLHEARRLAHILDVLLLMPTMNDVSNYTAYTRVHVNCQEFRMGIHYEMRASQSSSLAAAKTTVRHLCEKPTYYSRLLEIQKKFDSLQAADARRRTPDPLRFFALASSSKPKLKDD